jgi:hypothetical protein
MPTGKVIIVITLLRLVVLSILESRGRALGQPVGQHELG